VNFHLPEVVESHEGPGLYRDLVFFGAIPHRAIELIEYC